MISGSQMLTFEIRTNTPLPQKRLAPILTALSNTYVRQLLVLWNKAKPMLLTYWKETKQPRRQIAGLPTPWVLVISCYWLFKWGVLHVVCVRTCVCERERERERETGSHHSGVSCLNRGLCTANIYEHHHCLSHDSVLLSAWTDGKTKDIINCFYIYFESWS